MSGPLVRIAWEHTHRESLASFLMLRAIEAAGLDATLDHVEHLRSGRGTRPEIVLLPFYYDASDDRRYLRGLDPGRTAFINIAYEQMHGRAARRYLLPDGPRAARMMHTAWGPRFAGLLHEHGIEPGRVRTVGHPRFDIYRHPSLLFAREDLAARYALRREAPWILLPGSFNAAFVTDHHRRSLIRRGYELPRTVIEQTARERDAFVALVERLARAAPDVEVIFRVHPAGYESKALFAGRERPENAHVISEFDVASWIRAAALVVVWNSTTAMEAVVAGVPAVALEHEPYSEPFDYDVGRIVPRRTNPDDVVELVRALARGRPPEPSYDRARFAEWYAHTDGKNAERLAGVVREVASRFDDFVAAPRATAARRAQTWVTRVVDRIDRRVAEARGLRRRRASPTMADARRAATELRVDHLADYLR